MSGEPPTPAAPTPAVRTPWWAPVTVAVATGVLGFLRLSPTTRATLWAEDGRDFLGDRLREGPFAVWFDAYAGYLHVLPRLLADAVVSFVPVDAYAIGMTVAACAVVGIVGGLVVVCSRDVVPWLPARMALGLLTALVPAMPVEVLGNVANLHWALLWLAPWLLLAGPRTHGEGIGLGVVGLLGALTEIQMVWFLPLALLRLRDPKRWWVRGGVLLGLAGQAYAAIAWPREDPPGGDQSAAHVAVGYVVNGLTGAWTGSAELVGDLVRDVGVWPLALTAVPSALAALYVLVRGDGSQRLAAGALALGSMVLWSVAALVNPWTELGYEDYTPGFWNRFAFIRYGVVPALLLLALVALAAGVLHHRGARITPWVLLATLVVVVVPSFDVPRSERDDGPRWEAELARGRERCETAPPGAPVRLKLAPPGWAVLVACDQLGRG